MYGKELTLDLYDCDIDRFNRENLGEFFDGLVKLLDMEQGPRHFWDYDGAENEKAVAPDHLCGTTAVQFIYTSNITVHTLDKLRKVYLNIFSCKDFDVAEATRWCVRFFNAGHVVARDFERV